MANNDHATPDILHPDLNLSTADLTGADFSGADLSRANLSRADLSGADLSGADLTGANLSGAVLVHAAMVETILSGADLTGCRIYGISAWNLKLEATKQQNLVITRRSEPDVTVDNIEVAQFLYLLLRNDRIRHLIDTITSKIVLILGRFTPQRKAVLDALREELRRRDYLPILFDFDGPASRDITETISLLARMARFVVADITDARSIPQELNVIVPDLPSVPVQPLLLKESGEYGMFEHYTRYPWVLPIHRYETQDQLITVLGEQVIEPAERKAFELRAATKQVPVLQRRSTEEPSKQLKFDEPSQSAHPQVDAPSQNARPNDAPPEQAARKKSQTQIGAGEPPTSEKFAMLAIMSVVVLMITLATLLSQ